MVLAIGAVSDSVSRGEKGEQEGGVEGKGEENIKESNHTDICFLCHLFLFCFVLFASSDPFQTQLKSGYPSCGF